MHLSQISLALTRLSGQFSPASLFAAGEVGAWYDPSDLTTLFTDSAGTTPVTAVEQFVGLMLDKSKGGVGANGAARYNLLTYSEDQSNAIWSNYSATQSSNVAVAPNGTTTADKIVEVAGGANQARYNTVTGLISAAYTASIYFKQASGTDRQYANLSVSGVGIANWFAATFDLTGAGAVVKTGAGASGTYQSSSITAVGNGWYHCVVTGLTGQTGTSYFYAGPSDISNPTYGSYGVVSYTGDTAKGVLVWGADLRLASQANLAPTYQRITDSWLATLPGNHATSTGTKRPKLAARYNLLTFSEQFDNAAWAKLDATAANTTATTDPLGGTTADIMTASNATGFVYQSFTGTAVAYTLSFYAKAGTNTQITLDFVTLGFALGGSCTFTLTGNGTASAITQYGASTGYTASIFSVGNGWYRCTLTGVATATTWFWELRLLGNGTTVYIWGADLRPTSQATGLIGPTYQRVVDAATYDTVGFLPYLQFDGIDDSMSTGSIDFTATDKMTVWAGVRKLSDAGFGMVAELSPVVDANNGSFAVGASIAAAQRYVSALNGTGLAYYEPATYAAPITNVLATSFDIAGAAISNEISPRVNGILEQDNPTGANAGTGNFGNYPLNIGARNGGAGIFFNGWLTSLIVRGAQSTQSQIEATESWVNGKTGAF